MNGMLACHTAGEPGYVSPALAGREIWDREDRAPEVIGPIGQ
jgi:hypothetical protein